jgi:hypothetical protein
MSTGDATAVVDHLDRAVALDGDRDGVAEAGERLVDGVVDDLVDQVVQTPGTGRTDVHARALAHGLEPLEHLDVVCAVALVVVLLLIGGA